MTARLPLAAALVTGLVWAALALAGAKALLVDLDNSGRSLLLGLVLLALTEACVPWREQSGRASVRRLVQAALLAGNALLVGAGSPSSSGERVLLVLGGLVGVATALALGRAARSSAAGSDSRPPAPASPRARLALRVALGFVLALGAASVAWSACVPERRVVLAPNPEPGVSTQAWRQHDTLSVLPRFTLARVPDEARVLEDGRPLLFPNTPPDEIAALGSGRYQPCAGRFVHWSSSDGSDPLANGRRYELAFVPDVFHSTPVVLLFALAGGLVLVGASAGAVSLASPSSVRARAALVLAVLLGGGALMARSWDRIAVSPDTDGYLQHSPTRPRLYPAFVDLFDARPELPRGAEPTIGGRDEPTHRFVGVVRAQRVLTLVALAVLVWELSSVASVWLLATLVWVGALADLSSWGDRAIHANAGTLLAEGLGQPLVFLYAALVLAYARRASWAKGLALAVVLALLVLDRPASSALLVALPFVWALDARASGWRRASARAAVLALVYALPLLFASWQNYRDHGFFRTHALTGPNVFGTAFELADESDVAALEDPRARELLALCLASPTRRLPPDDGGFPDHNIYAIGLPALERIHDPPRGRGADFEIDDLLLAVGRKLIARHPVAYARQVLGEVGWILDEGVIPLLVALVLALVFYRRTGESTFLAFAFLASLPVVSVLPACFFHVPKPRYRCSFGWVECVGVPLLAALVVAARRPRPQAHATPVELERTT